METSQSRNLVRSYYEDRVRNDPRSMLKYFAPGARYVMAGDPQSSPVISTDLGPLTFFDIAPAIVDAWRWRAVEIRSALAEGGRAAVWFSLEVEFAPTKEIVTTEVANFWEFRNGLCVELMEFVDTALVSRIASATGSPQQRG